MPDEFTRRDLLSTAARAGLFTQIGPSATLSSDQISPPRRQNFDDSWRFTRGDPEGASLRNFSDVAWSVVNLPHDWSIAGPYGENEPSGGAGGYLPTGIGWYRKAFTPPANWAGKRVAIQFDGVYQRSDVWINGHHLGTRPYGFVSFAYDLTPYLSFDGAPSVIAVRVDNSLQPNARWYTGSGIYRHTWLAVTDPIHIAPWGVWARTDYISSGSATIEVVTRIRNDSSRVAICSLDTTVFDPSGGSKGLSTTHAKIERGHEHALTQRFQIVRPALWSLATPGLHQVKTALRASDGSRDSVSTSFGIRDARFDIDRGFLLNAERVKLNGVCLHGDCGAVGTAVPERMWESRLAALKEMGCNAIRCSHNPPAPEFLDLCDRMGFLVMGEPFDEWRQPKAQTPRFGYHKYFDEWGTRDLTDMLERDRNHPSIVIWSAGNEVPDQTDAEGPKTLQHLLDIFHSKDPTRPVTVACDNIAAEPKATPQEFLAELDVVGYNYVDRWRDRREKFYAIDRQDHPRRLFIGTESTGLGGVRGEYGFGDEQPVFGERTDNRRVEVEQLQKFIQTYDYVSGDFIWTGIDYLGEARWPSKLAASGVLDTCGFRKDSFYFYQSLWTLDPVLHLFPHWNWEGREGQIITVFCYTNCDTVELFLDDRSFGVKGFAFPRPGMIEKWPVYPDRAKALQTTADLHLTWDVPYAPGQLKALGTRDGKVVATTELRTTGGADALRLSADRNHIETGRSDVAHVRVEVLDRGGSLVPTAMDEITFDLQGECEIVGIDSGRPDSHEPYQANKRKVFNGLALVLVRSNGRPGIMTLSASARSLKSAQIQLTAG